MHLGQNLKAYKVGNKYCIKKPKVEMACVKSKCTYIYKKGINNKIRRGD